MEKLYLAIDGMSCGHCVARVSKALGELPGVKVGGVEVGSARIEYDPARVSVDRITSAIDNAGYAARVSGRPA